MSDFQQKIEYKTLLKSVPQALNGFFITHAIYDEESAALSPSRKLSEKIYPVLRCMVHELDYGYDVDIEPMIEDDRAFKSYYLARESFYELQTNDHFNDVEALDIAPGVWNQTSSETLHGIKDFVQELPQREDKTKAQAWLWLLGTIAQENMAAINQYLMADILINIENSEIGFEIANKIGFGDDSEAVSLIEKMMFAEFRTCLKNGQKPNLERLANSIFNAWEIDENKPDLKRLQKISSNCAQPLNEIADIFGEKYDNCKNLSEEIMDFNKDITDSEPDAENLKEIIFQQHLKENFTKSIQQKADILGGAMPKLSAKELEEIATHESSAQIKLAKEFGWISSQDARWDEYENHHEVSQNPELKQQISNLLKISLFQLGLGKVNEQGETEYLPDLLQFQNMVYDIIQGSAQPDGENLPWVLDFANMLITLDRAAEKHLGLQMSDKSLDYKLLDILEQKDYVSQEDFTIIYNYTISFTDALSQFINQKELLEEVDTSILEKNIDALPSGEEKLEALKLQYYFYALLERRSGFALAHVKGETNKVFTQVHADDFEDLTNNLSMIKEAYPELAKYKVEEIAQSINDGTNQAYLYPLYSQGLLNEFPDVAITQGDDEEISEEARNAIRTASQLYMSNVLGTHVKTAQDGKIDDNIVNVIRTQVQLENLENNSLKKIAELSDKANAENCHHDDYLLYKAKKKQYAPDEDLTRKLAIKRIKCHN